MRRAVRSGVERRPPGVGAVAPDIGGALVPKNTPGYPDDSDGAPGGISRLIAAASDQLADLLELAAVRPPKPRNRVARYREAGGPPGPTPDPVYWPHNQTGRAYALPTPHAVESGPTHYGPGRGVVGGSRPQRNATAVGGVATLPASEGCPPCHDSPRT